MKKLAAAVVALVLFLTLLTGVHLYALRSFPESDRSVGYWLSTEKDASIILLEKNIRPDSALILGSSELRKFKSSRVNPANLFNRENLSTMIIGSAVNQSLNHAILMAAVGSKVKSGKVVLILSPTWFYSHRDSAARYGMRLSRAFYYPAMDNEDLSGETKKQIRELMEKAFGGTLPSSFLENEKDIGRSSYAWAKSGRKKTLAVESTVQRGEPDFDKLRAKVISSEKGRINTEYNMYKNSKIMNPVIRKQSRRKNLGYDFRNSREYDYLELFIRVCKEQGISPVLVLQPINGKWYDYTGIDSAKREYCYDRIRRIARNNGVTLEDLSGEEYTEGFFCDAVHPSKKGWLMINEKIYSHIK